MNQKNRILIAEDDPSSGQLLQDFLRTHKYEVDWFHNGKEALDSYSPNKYNIVISDIEMPGMDGRELVEKIKSIDPSQIVMITTVHNDPSEIIGIMQNGVYDYFIKPIKLVDVINRINNAVEYSNLKTYASAIEKEKLIRLEEQVRWFKWMEERKNDVSQAESKDSFFYNLRTSLTQGAGFGQLVTVLEKLVKSAKLEDNRYWIKPQLMEIVQENLLSARNAINTFIEIDKMASDYFQLEKINLDSVYKSIERSIHEINSAYRKTGKSLQLSECKPSFESKFIMGNLQYLDKCWKELCINGLKFSPPNSNIVILVNHTDTDIEISFINPAYTTNSKITGIPIEYENIIFEPFYRIDHSLNQELETNDLGLGLSYVKNIINQHNGTIRLQNHNDHAFSNSDSPSLIVVAQLKIPLLQ
ncbi:MAG: response regulator [Leptospira sp.]|nr:response regulator [Leptospira sp.]